jgi:uncharacterized protein YprB with RNaseH-like and TPR domain
MLTNTFCHLPGVGEKTEQGLWSAGVHSWSALLAGPGVRPPCRVKPAWAGHIEESLSRLARRDPGYFAQRLAARQHWRLFRDFQDCCAFLDIETTGLSFGDQITTIALYDGRQVRYYVNGYNLDQFARDVQAYRLLVTYNGKSFDLPFIERYLGVRLPQAHIDLRHTLGSLGLKGGLKGCETRVGLGRPGLEGVDGFTAVLLWHDYRKSRNARALETLLAYNIQDAVSLHALMVHAHNAKLKQTPFAASHALPAPAAVDVPFRPDPETVARVTRGRIAGPFAYQNWRK